jgi:hypothetical protein
MAYVGQGIKNGTFSVLDTSGNTYNGSNVTFNLGTQVGSPAQLLVSHDGVIQKPVTDYTIATGGTQITFTTAPASGASIFITEISGAVGAPMNRDLNGDELILDVDGDTSITSDTDDQIDVRVSGQDQITIKDGAISPVTDNDVDLGTSSLEYKDGYFDGTLHCDVLDLAGTEHTAISSQWALISTTTASNSAKVEIRGLNDSDYFQFLLILDRVIPASDDVGMRILLENSANNNFGAYNYAILGYDDGGDEQRANGGNNSVINAVGGVGSASGEEGISGNIYIDNPSAQSIPTIQFHFTVMDKDGDIRVMVGSGQVKDDSEDANGIQLDFTSGNIESGTFKLYGLKAA